MPRPGEVRPGAIYHRGLILRASNCTFASNRGWPNTIRNSPLWDSIGELTQCIVRDGTPAFRGDLSITYSNVEGGYEGKGNIDVDPSFVAPGYWDPNGTPDDPNDDVWIMGDYHLKSQAGHWDEESESWVFDEVTSPCIDTGDPVYTPLAPDGSGGAIITWMDTRFGNYDIFAQKVSDIPTITSISVDSGPVGSEVAIQGTSFGDTQDTSCVSFGGVQADEYTSWSDTEIIVKVPSGVSGQLQVAVTTWAGPSNGMTFSVEPRRSS